MALDKFQPYLFVSAGEQSNKYLTPVISPDGIASFQAQRAQDLTGLTVRIDPIQKGTGDPSPTNIRPISGRTGLTVTRAGTNLLPPLASETKNGVTISVADDGTVTINGTASEDTYFDANFSLHISSGTPYYLCGFNPVASSSNRLTLFLITTGGNGQVNLNSANAVYSLITSTDVTVSRWRLRVPADLSLTNYIVKPMLQIGGSASSNYEPYTAQTYPISWQTEAGTIYGGTLDAVSGEMVVTKAFAVLNDPEKWVSEPSSTTINFSYDRKFRDRKIYNDSYTGLICSYLVVKSSSTETARWTGASSNLFGIRSSSITLEDIKAASVNNEIAICYELATPQTYQLTPTEVRTIAGFNQIYSDAGPVIDIKF